MRRGDIGQWSRMLRGVPARSPGYAATWYRSSEGQTRRPRHSDEARTAITQEWSRLLCEPQLPWDHPLVRKWVDGAGRVRGSLNMAVATDCSVCSMQARLSEAYLGPGAHGILVVRWVAGGVAVASEVLVHVSGWLLRWERDQWIGRRPGPCNGEGLRVVSVCGEDPLQWHADRWYFCEVTGTQGYVVLMRATEAWGDLVRPTSSAERDLATRRSKGSRPGRSGWKVAFLKFFPTWVQDAYWQLVDTQRACGLVASGNKRAVQVNMCKPQGGWRPLSMLEESFKGIEGPVARRKVLVRARLASGAIYSSANLAGEARRRATCEVLYVDALVCEDSQWHGRPFCRVPADYEKFYNTIELSSVDAVEEARGFLMMRGGWSRRPLGVSRLPSRVGGVCRLISSRRGACHKGRSQGQKNPSQRRSPSYACERAALLSMSLRQGAASHALDTLTTPSTTALAPSSFQV